MRRVNLRDAVVDAPAGAYVEILHSEKNTKDGRVQYAPFGAPVGYASPVIGTGVNQDLSGTGALAAIALDSAYTGISTVGGAATTTLPVSTIPGQMKSIEMLADAGDCVITVAGSGTGSIATITLNDVGDACTVMWNGTGWMLSTNVGCALTYN